MCSTHPSLGMAKQREGQRFQAIFTTCIVDIDWVLFLDYGQSHFVSCMAVGETFLFLLQENLRQNGSSLTLIAERTLFLIGYNFLFSFSSASCAQTTPSGRRPSPARTVPSHSGRPSMAPPCHQALYHNMQVSPLSLSYLLALLSPSLTLSPSLSSSNKMD